MLNMRKSDRSPGFLINAKAKRIVSNKFLSIRQLYLHKNKSLKDQWILRGILNYGKVVNEIKTQSDNCSHHP